MSIKQYDQALTASKDNAKQLGLAVEDLGIAQMKLGSLEAGLAAAQAAALAS